MNKMSEKTLQEKVEIMLTTKKKRKFLETVELQILLQRYDVGKYRRFNSIAILPHEISTKRKFCLIGDEEHTEEALKLGIDIMNLEGLAKFNRDYQVIKRWSKKYHKIFCTDSIIRQIPRIMGLTMARLGKFPISISHNESLVDKIKLAKKSVKFQLKKVLNLNYAIGNVGMEAEEIRENLFTAIYFLVGLLKKGWSNIKTMRIKTTMGIPVVIYEHQ